MGKTWRNGVVAVVVASAGVMSIGSIAPASAAASSPSPVSATVAGGGRPQHHELAIVSRWEAAWTKNQPSKMAALFTRDSTYTDLAFGAVWRGQAEIGQWVTKTHAVIKDTRVTVSSSFRSGNQIAIEWTFSGVMPGATKPFSVPATTIMKLRGDRIVSNTDYYNLADLLRQSGLPAEWPPPGN